LYFFFHFQYNGWFTFAIIGLFFAWLEQQKINFNLKAANLFFIFSTLAIVPAYSLSLIGMSFGKYFLVIGYISASLQLISLLYFIKSLLDSFSNIKHTFNNWSYSLLAISFLSFIVKELLQAASTLPFLEDYAFLNKSVIIAYIHLTMIGFISFFLLSLLFQLNWMFINSKTVKTGILMLIIGYVFSEFILVLLGLTTFLYLHEAIAIFSFIMAIGIDLILIKQFRGSKIPLNSDI